MDLGDDNKILQSGGDQAVDKAELTDTNNEPLIVGDSKPSEIPTELGNDVIPSPVPESPVPEQQVSSVTPTTMSPNHAIIIQEGKESASERKKEDEKLGIYKALAIKLKKELVKSREELQRTREDSQKKCTELQDRVKTLEDNFESERNNSTNTIKTLEARVRDLKQQLETSETDIQSVQNDFENYKIRASQIMQQNSSLQSNSNKTFEEERYKQLKLLNDEQRNAISNLESQFRASLERSKDLEKELKIFQDRLEIIQVEANRTRILEDKCETLSRENENLKIAIKQFRTKLKPDSTNPLSYASQTREESREGSANESTIIPSSASDNVFKKTSEGDISGQTSSKGLEKLDFTKNSQAIDDRPDDTSQARLSPGASIKDESQTNSSSSFDGSTSGYVHIKPATFEIISRSSILEDAQNQIDNLTKAYLDSENTNSLLSDQVRALKEEIRRMQRGTERMDLAENLEYLKNIVFKFLSLDYGQIEQKQRLVPVLSTVLKLSPEETGKLNSLIMVDKMSMAGSFFKL